MISYQKWQFNEVDAIDPEIKDVLGVLQRKVINFVKSKTRIDDPNLEKELNLEINPLLRQIIRLSRDSESPVMAAASPSQKQAPISSKEVSPEEVGTEPELPQKEPELSQKEPEKKPEINPFKVYLLPNLGMLLKNKGDFKKIAAAKKKSLNIVKQKILSGIQSEMQSFGYGEYFQLVKDYIDAANKGQIPDDLTFALEQIAQKKKIKQSKPTIEKTPPEELSYKEKIRLIRFPSAEMVKKLMLRGVHPDTITKVNPMVDVFTDLYKNYYNPSIFTK